MSNPLASICVPTFNRAVALREGLASILAQDYAPLEILISDNGSSDETEKICRQAAQSDPRIRYFRQPRNIGLYPNHNFLLDASRGEFLCFFHDHDVRAGSIVREYVSFLKQHSEAGVVCSDWDLLDETGRSFGMRHFRVPSVTPGLAYIDRTFRSGRSSIAAPGAMIRRSSLGSIRFDESGPLGFGDFLVWFQIAERCAVGHVQKTLWGCRQLRASQSARTIESMTQDYDVNLNRYCDDYLKRWPTHTRRAERWRRQIRRFLFWALAYEVGLHFRKNRPLGRRTHAPTLFEILDYRLTPEAFDRALERLQAYRTGVLQETAHGIIQTLVRTKATAPLVWATYNPTLFRKWLKLN